jgi:MFS family permease
MSDSRPEKKAHLLSPLLIVFLGAMILANIGGQMFYPLQALYLKELGADVGQMGLFFTLSMIVPLAMQIFGGWVGDHIGRLKAMAIGSVAGSLGWIGMIFAPSWPWLLAAESVGSIAGAFVGPSFDAFIAEQSDEKNRGRVFAASQTLFLIVAVVGPLAGGFAVRTYGFKTVIIIAALLYFAATAIRIALSRAHPRAPNKEEQNAPNGFGASLKTIGGMALAGGLVTWLLISDGARDIAMALSGNLFPLFLQEQRGFDAAGIGGLESIFGLASMLVMMPAGLFSDRCGERVAIATGYFAAFLAFLAFIFMPGYLATGLAYVAFGIAIGMLTPAYQSLISKAIPENLRGIAFGFLSTSNGLLSLPAPFLGGILWKTYGPRLPLLITAFSLLFIIVPVLLKFRLPPDTKNADPAHEPA